METKKNISDNLKLHSDNVKKILSTSPHWMIRWANTIIFIVLLLMILMSYFIKYPEYIRAPILFTSQNHSEKVNAKTLKTETFKGKTPISLTDFRKIVPCQKISIRLDKYHGQEYGTVTGKIQNINAVPHETGKYYVEFILSEGSKTSYNKNLPLDQELKGEAEIMIKDVRLIERFFHKIR